MAGSVLGSAALQNIFSRDVASSRICLRVLVLDSRLFTQPWSRTCTQKSQVHLAAAVAVIALLGASSDPHQLLALSLAALQQQRAQAGVQSRLHALDQVPTLQHLLLQSAEVIHVADGVAAVPVGVGAIGGFPLQLRVRVQGVGWRSKKVKT